MTTFQLQKSGERKVSFVLHKSDSLRGQHVCILRASAKPLYSSAQEEPRSESPENVIEIIPGVKVLRTQERG